MKNKRFATILFILIFIGLLPALIMGCSTRSEDNQKQIQSDPTDPGLKPGIDPNSECPYTSEMNRPDDQCSQDGMNMHQEGCEEHADQDSCSHDNDGAGGCGKQGAHEGDMHEEGNNEHHSDEEGHHQ